MYFAAFSGKPELRTRWHSPLWLLTLVPAPTTTLLGMLFRRGPIPSKAAYGSGFAGLICLGFFMTQIVAPVLLVPNHLPRLETSLYIPRFRLNRGALRTTIVVIAFFYSY